MMPPPGIRALDHTADVGMEVRGDSLAQLFTRAAAGAIWTATGKGPHGAEDGVRVQVELEADDLEGLLRSWLRDLLYRFEVEGQEVSGVDDLSFSETGSGTFTLSATVHVVPAPEHPLREIKGVTWHGLTLRGPSAPAPGWFARVIYDV
ncbi:MAG: archease [Gemmatimonadales bacterium]|nr:MAG: archease [Gemmatimonadales bacterium]